MHVEHTLREHCIQLSVLITTETGDDRAGHLGPSLLARLCEQRLSPPTDQSWRRRRSSSTSTVATLVPPLLGHRRLWARPGSGSLHSAATWPDRTRGMHQRNVHLHVWEESSNASCVAGLHTHSLSSPQSLV